MQHRSPTGRRSEGAIERTFGISDHFQTGSVIVEIGWNGWEYHQLLDPGSCQLLLSQTKGAEMELTIRTTGEPPKLHMGREFRVRYGMGAARNRLKQIGADAIALMKSGHR